MARGDSRKGHLGNVVGGGRESFTPAVCRRLELLRAIDGAVPLVGAFPEVPHLLHLQLPLFGKRKQNRDGAGVGGDVHAKVVRVVQGACEWEIVACGGRRNTRRRRKTENRACVEDARKQHVPWR